MKDGQPPPIQNPTLILFLGLFLILLAFFIMLNTLSVVDAEKSVAAMDSVNSQFGEAVFVRPVSGEIKVVSEAVIAEGFHGKIELSFKRGTAAGRIRAPAGLERTAGHGSGLLALLYQRIQNSIARRKLA